jgi:hypothetical protein
MAGTCPAMTTLVWFGLVWFGLQRSPKERLAIRKLEKLDCHLIAQRTKEQRYQRYLEIPGVSSNLIFFSSRRKALSRDALARFAQAGFELQQLGQQ